MGKLIHTEGRIIVSVDMNYKNSHTFSDGTKISLERKYDNFDQKYTQPVNAIVISAEHIPEGSEIIIHHNCTHETNRINNYKALSGEDIASDVRYFSIKETEAFAWRNRNVSSNKIGGMNIWNHNAWEPLRGFDFALRVFKPYFGVIEGIEPTLIKNILWITTGEYKNNAVVTLKHCDYQLIFQDINGREGNIIRLRSSENKEEQRECEIIALHNDYTEKILDGQLHVGLTKSDAKSLNKLQLK